MTRFALRSSAVLNSVLPIFLMLILGIFAATLPAHAQSQPATPSTSVPRLVQFNGTLKDAAARPVAGVASVTFAIYAEQEGGTALWSETQNVIADANGHYNALLGGATPAGMPAELFGTGQSRWLGVTVARQPEMARVLLASVPYALKAGDAETLGGLPASAYVTTQSLATIKSGTTILAPGSTTIPIAPQNSSSASGSEAATPATLPISNATPSGSGTTDYIPLWTSGSALGNSILFQTGGLVGINTTAPAETLDVNGNSIFRGSFQLPPGHPAIATSGYESHSFQFQASSFNSTTGTSNTEAFGFRAEPLNNNTASPSAKLDLFFGAGGNAPFTDTGFSFAANGIVTFAPNQTFTFAPTQTFNGYTGSLADLDLNPSGAIEAGIITYSGLPFVGIGASLSNIYVGGAAGGTNAVSQTGVFNSALGEQALYSNTSGSQNVAVGSAALVFNTSGNNNVAVGYEALENATASYNTAVGYQAALGGSLGSFNTALGANAIVGNGVSNSTAIGYGADVETNHALALGGNGANAVSVGIGTAFPTSLLDIESPIASGAMSPSPVITLTNTAGGLQSTTAIDFNSYIPQGGTYNPDGRLAFVDEGSYSGAFVFYGNKSGARDNGLQQNMALDADGNLSIRGGLTAGGTVIVQGDLIKAGGSFKIDDPIAPSEKYLSHSFVESPDMMNIYNGIVTLDAHGAALVQMPEWFSALNRDFRYQLTAMGAPGPKLYIAAEITANHFQIAGGKKGQRVSWQVTGIRHDAWADAHRIPTEEEKPANEQGTYLHPELFGAPPQQGISAANSPAAPPRAD